MMEYALNMSIAPGADCTITYDSIKKDVLKWLKDTVERRLDLEIDDICIGYTDYPNNLFTEIKEDGS